MKKVKPLVARDSQELAKVFTHDISTDLMLRVLASLGVRAKLQFKNAA